MGNNLAALFHYVSWLTHILFITICATSCAGIVIRQTKLERSGACLMKEEKGKQKVLVEF